MNKDIERINEENRRQNDYISPGDQSQAKHSSITTPDEDNKRSIAEGIIQELGNHTQEIDSIKEAVKVMADQINALTGAINQLVQGTTPQQPGTPQANGLNMENISALGDLAEKAMSAWKIYKGDGQAAPQIIDQNFINEKMKQSFMDNLQTGEAITNFIKDSLKKKVTKEVINQSLADMGKDTHAPQ